MDELVDLSASRDILGTVLSMLPVLSSSVEEEESRKVDSPPKVLFLKIIAVLP